MTSSLQNSAVAILSSDEVKVILVEGLHRVARIIDTSSDYNAIIGHKFGDDFKDQLSCDVTLPQKRKFALEYWQKTIETSKQATYAFPDVDVLFLGRTKNNLREFSFFKKILSDTGRPVTTFNAVDLKFQKKEHSSDDLALVTEAYIPVLEGYLDSRSDIGPEVIYQQGQFIVHFIRYVFSLSRKDSRRPILAVVANDHSPNPVAFSLAMRAFNVTRVYLQHAEVSPNFPPLDFEYSILRNQTSLHTYEDISKPLGKTYVISRFTEPFKKPTTPNSGTPQSVVIYTTGRVDEQGFKAVVDRLLGNQSVSAIFVKPHPNQAPVVWPDGVSVLGGTPDFPHVALVSNSSVVIELLHRGIPTFQNFDFDPVEPDYYGFVRNRVSCHAPTETLDTQFWASFAFDDEWYTQYSNFYVPAESKSEPEKAAFIQKVSALLKQQGRPRFGVRISQTKLPIVKKPQKSKLSPRKRKILEWVSKLSTTTTLEAIKYFVHESSLRNKEAIKQIRASSPPPVVLPAANDPDRLKWVEVSISNSKKPDIWINDTLAINLATDEDMIKSLESLFLKRDPVVFALFDLVDNIEQNLFVYLWLSFKRSEITGVDLPYHLDGMVEALIAAPNVRYIKASLEGLAFNACLRANRLDVLEKLFTLSFRLKRETLSTTRRVALLRHLLAKGDLPTYEVTRQEFWAAETPLHRLKISDLDSAFGTHHGNASHSQIEFAFEQSAPVAISSEYIAHVKPVYDLQRANMAFMDVRSNEKERSNFKEKVLNALVLKKPFSMIRLSDGEGYAFASEHEFFSLEDQLNRERHWWGVELGQPLRTTIERSVREAVETADVLGIPSIHRLVRDVHDKSLSLKANVQGRGLMQVINHFSAHRWNSEFGDEKMNIPLFRSIEFVTSLAKAADCCVVVSSAGAEHVPTWLSELTEVVHIPIPTHFRTSRNEKYHAAEKPLPFVYEEIKILIQQSVHPGTLVLVAGGIIGKIFIDTAKRSGGVAIDLGSVMDEWLDAGIHSLH